MITNGNEGASANAIYEEPASLYKFTVVGLETIIEKKENVAIDNVTYSFPATTTASIETIPQDFDFIPIKGNFINNAAIQDTAVNNFQVNLINTKQKTFSNPSKTL